MIAATGAAATSTPLEAYLAPTGGLAFALGLVAFIVRQWREGRAFAVEQARRDVEAANARALTEKTRADEVERELAEDIGVLKRQLDQVQRELAELRAQYTSDLEAAHRRLENEIRVSFRLREHMAAHGLDLPPDLDPARPDVRPNLYPGEGR